MWCCFSPTPVFVRGISQISASAWMALVHQAKEQLISCWCFSFSLTCKPYKKNLCSGRKTESGSFLLVEQSKSFGLFFCSENVQLQLDEGHYLCLSKKTTTKKTSTLLTFSFLVFWFQTFSSCYLSVHRFIKVGPLLQKLPSEDR